MTEKFLHYLWSMKLLKNNFLQTESGEKIQIIHAGEYNTNAGPDFLNARIRIGDTLWAGNVEIHMKSSAWNAHRHQNDKAYDNIVLHVVYKNDQPVSREDGSTIPCLIVKHQFDTNIYANYQSLMGSNSWIPCERHLYKVPSIVLQQWLHRLQVERIEEKIQPILAALTENQHNWEETFYQFLATAFGARINAEPFLQLTRALPVKVLARHKNNLFQLEALLFGTAGFLEEKFADAYPNELKKEFSFLKKKYGLEPVKKHIWKFLRLRPANFPSIRIAQFAQLIYKSSHLFSKITESREISNLAPFFEVTASAYWDDHYRFDHTSISRQKSFGTTAISLLLINTVVPFLFLFGKYRDEDAYCERALDVLEHVPAEDNKILKNWSLMGIQAANAFESQALLQLHNNYCKNFRCLDCAVGHKVLLQNDQPSQVSE